MKVKNILVPVYTTDFERTILDYEKLLGEKTQNKFDVDSIKISVAKINNFLIIGGNEETIKSLPEIRASLVVDSLDEYFNYLTSKSSTILQPPTKTPTGRNMIAKQIDGNIFEYVELENS